MEYNGASTSRRVTTEVASSCSLLEILLGLLSFHRGLLHVAFYRQLFPLYVVSIVVFDTNKLIKRYRKSVTKKKRYSK